jgi:type IV pilus assembly protein PilB
MSSKIASHYEILIQYENPMPKKNVLLGDFLVAQGLVTEDQLSKALKHQKDAGKMLGRSLIDLGFLTEKEMVKALGEQLGVQYVSLKNYRTDPAVIKLIPEEIARQHQVLPLFRIDKTLTVGMVNPLDVVAIDAISRTCQLKVEPVVCSEIDIQEAIDQFYGRRDLAKAAREVARAQLLEQEQAPESPSGFQFEDARTEPSPGDERKLRREAEEAPVIKMANLIITQAVKDRASDIHIEPLERGTRVRYRIDGVMHLVYEPPQSMQLALVSRIKILASLNIAERRLPQDGRFQMEIDERTVDFRVSVLPAAFGEAVVLRILDTSRVLHLTDLGLSPENLKKIENLISHPHGIILVTGPTGSGKSSTLYAALQQMQSHERNIITLEDPIEYRLDGIRQSQVNAKIGMTFAHGLRAILRQDPDIIMVGEIRDAETAEIAVHAALTGHLVLSTLHTNDAAGAVSRLVDMGVESYLLASSLDGVVAQRLVRRICPDCRQEIPLSRALRELLRLPAGYPENTGNGHTSIYKGRGCNRCRRTGYRGRVAIYEILTVDETIQQLMIEKVPAAQIKAAAIAAGMRTLFQDAVDKVLLGVTTVEEVLRVTKPD